MKREKVLDLLNRIAHQRIGYTKEKPLDSAYEELIEVERKVRRAQPKMMYLVGDYAGNVRDFRRRLCDAKDKRSLMEPWKAVKRKKLDVEILKLEGIVDQLQIEADDKAKEFGFGGVVDYMNQQVWVTKRRTELNDQDLRALKKWHVDIMDDEYLNANRQVRQDVQKLIRVGDRELTKDIHELFRKIEKETRNEEMSEERWEMIASELSGFELELLGHASFDGQEEEANEERRDADR